MALLREGEIHPSLVMMLRALDNLQRQTSKLEGMQDEQQEEIEYFDPVAVRSGRNILFGGIAMTILLVFGGIGTILFLYL